MEADLFAFYGVTGEDIKVMSWRRLQTLARGLIGRDGSKWWMAMTADINVGEDSTWTPPQAPTGSTEEQEARLRAAFGLSRKVVTAGD